MSCLRSDAAGVRIACDRAAVGAPLCCVAVASRELQCAVNKRVDHWGSGGPSVVVRVVENVVRVSEAQGCVAGKCGVVV